MMRSPITINDYQSNRDHDGVAALFQGDPWKKERFHRDAVHDAPPILIASRGEEIVAALLYGNIGQSVNTMMAYKAGADQNEVGTALLTHLDQMIAPMDVVEHTTHYYGEVDDSYTDMLSDCGYRPYFSGVWMARTGAPFGENAPGIRPYQTTDYQAWEWICAQAWYGMRQAAGITPNFYIPPSNTHQAAYQNNAHNMYVLEVGECVVATGEIDGDELSQVTVHPDHQSQGYGRAMTQFLIDEILRRGCETVRLSVIEGNHVRHLYKRLGFTVTSRYHYAVKYYRPDSRMTAPPA